MTSWQIGGIAAGLHLVATLPSRSDERRIAEAARSRDVGFHPMSLYCRDRAHRNQPALVFGYGHLTETEIEDGMQQVFGVRSRHQSG